MWFVQYNEAPLSRVYQFNYFSLALVAIINWIRFHFYILSFQVIDWLWSSQHGRYAIMEERDGATILVQRTDELNSPHKNCREKGGAPPKYKLNWKDTLPSEAPPHQVGNRQKVWVPERLWKSLHLPFSFRLNSGYEAYKSGHTQNDFIWPKIGIPETFSINRQNHSPNLDLYGNPSTSLTAIKEKVPPGRGWALQSRSSTFHL